MNEEMAEMELSESFTTSYGTQVRVMYNLRLLVSRLDDVFQGSFGMGQLPSEILPAQEAAYRAQTASSLYQCDLSGVIILLKAKDFAKYAQGKSANRGSVCRVRLMTWYLFSTLLTVDYFSPKVFIEKCKKSTEFHFSSIESQIKQIETDLPKDETGAPMLQEGK